MPHTHTTTDQNQSKKFASVFFCGFGVGLVWVVSLLSSVNSTSTNISTRFLPTTWTWWCPWWRRHFVLAPPENSLSDLFLRSRFGSQRPPTARTETFGRWLWGSQLSCRRLFIVIIATESHSHNNSLHTYTYTHVPTQSYTCTVFVSVCETRRRAQCTHTLCIHTAHPYASSMAYRDTKRQTYHSTSDMPKVPSLLRIFKYFEDPKDLEIHYSQILYFK